jgi:hypothetical protein
MDENKKYREFKSLCLDIGGGGIKIGIYKINQEHRVPYLVSEIKSFYIKGDKSIENIYNHFQRKVKDVQKYDYICVSMSSTFKIFHNWRDIERNKRSDFDNMLKDTFINKYNIPYLEKPDVECHYLGCKYLYQLFNKKIMTCTFVLGTSPCIFVTGKNGKEIERSGGLIKGKDFLWQSSLHKEFDAIACNKYPPKKDTSKNAELSLEEWLEENKKYFWNFWNLLIKPIFISGGNDILNGWHFEKPPKYIFIAGGMSDWRLANYIPLMNKWLTKSSKFYKKTNIILAPRYSGLIGAACIPLEHSQ